MKQDCYEIQLTDKIKAVQSSAERFADFAKVCSYEVQEATRQEVKRLRNENSMDYVELGRRIDIARVERFQQSNEIGTVVANDGYKTRQAMDVMG